jgi:cell division protein ZapA
MLRGHPQTMGQKRSYNLTVGGQRYTIKSDADASYVEGLARLVDGRMKEIQKGWKAASAHAVAVLTALQLADELERQRRARTELRRRVRDRARALKQLLDRELRDR